MAEFLHTYDESNIYHSDDEDNEPSWDEEVEDRVLVPVLTYKEGVQYEYRYNTIDMLIAPKHAIMTMSLMDALFHIMMNYDGVFLIVRSFSGYLRIIKVSQDIKEDDLDAIPKTGTAGEYAESLLLQGCDGDITMLMESGKIKSPDSIYISVINNVVTLGINEIKTSTSQSTNSVEFRYNNIMGPSGSYTSCLNMLKAQFLEKFKLSQFEPIFKNNLTFIDLSSDLENVKADLGHMTINSLYSDNTIDLVKTKVREYMNSEACKRVLTSVSAKKCANINCDKFIDPSDLSPSCSLHTRFINFKDDNPVKIDYYQLKDSEDFRRIKKEPQRICSLIDKSIKIGRPDYLTEDQVEKLSIARKIIDEKKALNAYLKTMETGFLVDNEGNVGLHVEVDILRTYFKTTSPNDLLTELHKYLRFETGRIYLHQLWSVMMALDLMEIAHTRKVTMSKQGKKGKVKREVHLSRYLLYKWFCYVQIPSYDSIITVLKSKIIKLRTSKLLIPWMAKIRPIVFSAFIQNGVSRVNMFRELMVSNISSTSGFHDAALAEVNLELLPLNSILKQMCAIVPNLVYETPIKMYNNKLIMGIDSRYPKNEELELTSLSPELKGGEAAYYRHIIYTSNPLKLISTFEEHSSDIIQLLIKSHSLPPTHIDTYEGPVSKKKYIVFGLKKSAENISYFDETISCTVDIKKTTIENWKLIKVRALVSLFLKETALPCLSDLDMNALYERYTKRKALVTSMYDELVNAFKNGFARQTALFSSLVKKCTKVIEQIRELQTLQDYYYLLAVYSNLFVIGILMNDKNYVASFLNARYRIMSQLPINKVYLMSDSSKELNKLNPRNQVADEILSTWYVFETIHQISYLDPSNDKAKLFNDGKYNYRIVEKTNTMTSPMLTVDVEVKDMIMINQAMYGCIQKIMDNSKLVKGLAALTQDVTDDWMATDSVGNTVIQGNKLAISKLKNRLGKLKDVTRIPEKKLMDTNREVIKQSRKVCNIYPTYKFTRSIGLNYAKIKSLEPLESLYSRNTKGIYYRALHKYTDEFLFKLMNQHSIMFYGKPMCESTLELTFHETLMEWSDSTAESIVETIKARSQPMKGLQYYFIMKKGIVEKKTGMGLIRDIKENVFHYFKQFCIMEYGGLLPLNWARGKLMYYALLCQIDKEGWSNPTNLQGNARKLDEFAGYTDNLRNQFLFIYNMIHKEANTELYMTIMSNYQSLQEQKNLITKSPIFCSLARPVLYPVCALSHKKGKLGELCYQTYESVNNSYIMVLHGIPFTTKSSDQIWMKLAQCNDGVVPVQTFMKEEVKLREITMNNASLRMTNSAMEQSQKYISNNLVSDKLYKPDDKYVIDDLDNKRLEKSVSELYSRGYYLPTSLLSKIYDHEDFVEDTYLPTPDKNFIYKYEERVTNCDLLNQASKLSNRFKLYNTVMKELPIRVNHAGSIDWMNGDLYFINDNNITKYLNNLSDDSRSVVINRLEEEDLIKRVSYAISLLQNQRMFFSQSAYKVMSVAFRGVTSSQDIKLRTTMDMRRFQVSMSPYLLSLITNCYTDEDAKWLIINFLDCWKKKATPIPYEFILQNAINSGLISVELEEYITESEPMQELEKELDSKKLIVSSNLIRLPNIMSQGMIGSAASIITTCIQNLWEDLVCMVEDGLTKMDVVDEIEYYELLRNGYITIVSNGTSDDQSSCIRYVCDPTLSNNSVNSLLIDVNKWHIKYLQLFGLQVSHPKTTLYNASYCFEFNSKCFFANDVSFNALQQMSSLSGLKFDTASKTVSELISKCMASFENLGDINAAFDYFVMALEGIRKNLSVKHEYDETKFDNMFYHLLLPDYWTKEILLFCMTKGSKFIGSKVMYEMAQGKTEFSDKELSYAKYNYLLFNPDLLSSFSERIAVHQRDKYTNDYSKPTGLALGAITQVEGAINLPDAVILSLQKQLQSMSVSLRPSKMRLDSTVTMALSGNLLYENAVRVNMGTMTVLNISNLELEIKKLDKFQELNLGASNLYSNQMYDPVLGSSKRRFTKLIKPRLALTGDINVRSITLMVIKIVLTSVPNWKTADSGYTDILRLDGIKIYKELDKPNSYLESYQLLLTRCAIKNLITPDQFNIYLNHGPLALVLDMASAEGLTRFENRGTYSDFCNSLLTSIATNLEKLTAVDFANIHPITTLGSAQLSLNNLYSYYIKPLKKNLMTLPKPERPIFSMGTLNSLIINMSDTSFLKLHGVVTHDGWSPIKAWIVNSYDLSMQLIVNPETLTKCLVIKWKQRIIWLICSKGNLLASQFPETLSKVLDDSFIPYDIKSREQITHMQTTASRLKVDPVLNAVLVHSAGTTGITNPTKLDAISPEKFFPLTIVESITIIPNLIRSVYYSNEDISVSLIEKYKLKISGILSSMSLEDSGTMIQFSNIKKEKKELVIVSEFNPDFTYDDVSKYLEPDPILVYSSINDSVDTCAYSFSIKEDPQPVISEKSLTFKIDKFDLTTIPVQSVKFRQFVLDMQSNIRRSYKGYSDEMLKLLQRVEPEAELVTYDESDLTF